MATEPRTLLEANVYFANPDNCVSYLVARRWPAGVMCHVSADGRLLYPGASRVAVQDAAPEGAIFGEGRHDLRGLPNQP